MKSFGNIAFSVILCVVYAIPRHAHADGETYGPWKITFGGGPVSEPAYLGSDRQKAQFVPFAEALYDDGAFYASTEDGIGFNPIGNTKSYIGAGFGFERGRRQHDDGMNLNGLGNVDDSETANIHGHYETTQGYYAEGAINSGLNGGYGAVGTAAIGREWDATTDLSFDISALTDIADGDHMRENFGISLLQAERSGLPSYRTSAGIRDYRGKMETDYNISPFAYVAATASAMQLTGDAARSPVTKRNVVPTAGLSLNYFFR